MPDVVHPGQRIREMLKKRGWRQEELVRITGKSRQTISAIIGGRASITPETAVAFGAAFGNAPAQWLRWGAEYDLSLTETDRAEVECRARLYNLAPIREMQKRGWIPAADNVADLESTLEKFFGGSVTSPLAFPVAARRTVTLDQLNGAEKAWCFRARQLASSVLAAEFATDRLPLVEKRLRKAAAYPREAAKVPKILSEFGIRFIVIEPIPGAKIDGASFWLDETRPVIALSLRYDRFDAFWFTLFHEFAHIKHGDSLSVDIEFLKDKDGAIVVDLAGDDQERRANETAADILIPKQEMESFISRLSPYYSSDRVVQFAHRVKMHPGIIVGQLQYRGEIGYHALREFLVKIRSTITETALTDGWGLTIAPGLL